MTFLVYITSIFIILCIISLCVFIYSMNTSRDFYTNNLITNIDIDVYVLSWKKVNDNAVTIYKEVSRVFPSTYFIDCDENSSNNFKNIIRLTDKDYYGTQFNTAIQSSPSHKVIGIIVGDIQTNLTDWNKVYINVLTNFTDLDVGIYAPFEERTYWQQSKGNKMFDDNLYLTDNTDCTVWFLSPEIVSFAKKLDIVNQSFYGWGIDLLLCKYSYMIGKNVIVDKSVKVRNPKGSGYDGNKASEQMSNIYKYATQNNLISDFVPEAQNHFITFQGDESIDRISTEAIKLQYFKTVTSYTKAYYKDEINNCNSWIFKYKIILETLYKYDINDIVVYFDSQCTLNKEKIKECVQYTSYNDFTCFKNIDDNSIIPKCFFIRKCLRMINFFTIVLNYISMYTENKQIEETTFLRVCIEKILKNKVAFVDYNFLK